MSETVIKITYIIPSQTVQCICIFALSVREKFYALRTKQSLQKQIGIFSRFSSCVIKQLWISSSEISKGRWFLLKSYYAIT